MKFLIVFACALAVASSGYVAPVATVYAGAQHLPVIGANGVPVDTAEVQHATAAHLAHKVEAHVRNGDYAVAAPVVAAPVVAAHSAYAAPWTHSAYAAPLAHSAYAAPWTHSAYAVPWAYSSYAAHQAYPTTAVHPTSFNGVPQETPEVAAARLNHYAAHVEANTRALHYRKRRGIYTPVAPVVASTYAYSPVATSYSHQSSYVHHTPSTVFASTYAHPFAYSAHYY